VPTPFGITAERNAAHATHAARATLLNAFRHH